MACLQVCSQHTAQSEMSMTWTGDRVLVTSKGGSRQKLYSDLENEHRVETGRQSGPDVAEDDKQLAGYFMMIRTGTELRLWTCERLLCIVRTFAQSGVKELSKVSVVLFVKVSSHFVLAIDRDNFYVGSAYSDGI